MTKPQLPKADFGFTGTRAGMTDRQAHTLRKVLRVWASYSANQLLVFHHGDCVGADAEAHDIVRELGWHVHLHPGADAMDPLRAGRHGDWQEPVKPPLARNRDIVKASTFMYACPVGNKEELRSGTWATIRYAKELGKPLTIVWPNGSTTAYRGRPSEPAQEKLL